MDKTLGYRFLKEGSGGGALVVHIIFRRLPLRLKEELVRFVGTPYPRLSSIFDTRITILKSWEAIQPERRPKISMFADSSRTSQITRKEEVVTPTVENFHTQQEQESCNFCLREGHASKECKDYITFHQRRRRCQELGLCYRCTYSNHSYRNCPSRKGLRRPCDRCSSSDHSTAMWHAISSNERLY